MKPSLALPFHDPDGTMFAHLQAILPDLESHFEHAYITIPEATKTHQPENIAKIKGNPFFRVFLVDSESPVGAHFTYLYSQSAQAAQPDEIMHLCYPDRLSFALETDYREQFLANVDSLSSSDLPLIFHRSPRAWETHPKNYFELESFVTRIGENLLSQSLDFGWCHIVMSAGKLRQIMPKITHSDLSVVAEMVLQLLPDIKTREVDWLAWEDPFITGREAAELKCERENSLEETQKRLSYVLPMVDAITKFSVNGKHKQE